MLQLSMHDFFATLRLDISLFFGQVSRKRILCARSSESNRKQSLSNGARYTLTHTLYITYYLQVCYNHHRTLRIITSIALSWLHGCLRRRNKKREREREEGEGAENAYSLEYMHVQVLVVSFYMLMIILITFAWLTQRGIGERERESGVHSLCV